VRIPALMYRHYILIISASIKLQYAFVCVVFITHNKLSHAAQATGFAFAALHDSKELLELAKRVHYVCCWRNFQPLNALPSSRAVILHTNTPAFIHLLRSRRCRIITPRARFVVRRVDQGKKMKFHFLQGRIYARHGARTKPCFIGLCVCYYFASAHAHRTDNFGSREPFCHCSKVVKVNTDAWGLCFKVAWV
jgi:hypothetical protein